MRRILAVLGVALFMVVIAAPVSFAQAEEIAVTGVIEDVPDKADGTPAYGITDESSVTGTAPPTGYILEGDYSAYVGKRITVHGLPESGHAERVLDVTRIE